MKMKVLSLILVLMLLPIASLFGACGNNDGIDLNLLDDEYKTIATENNNIKLNENGSFEFDYQDAELKRIINETSPYNQLLKYNEVFYNLMSFANEYIDECADNSKTANNDIKEQVYDDLKELKSVLSDLNMNINMLAEVIVQESNAMATACRSRFETLLDTYENVFQSSISFNNSLFDLYFNNILKDGNPNVYSNGFENFDSSIVVNKLRSRIYYQKSNLSQCFVEICVYEGLAKQISQDEIVLNLNDNNYLDNILKINKIFDEEKAVEVANNSKNKASFYDLAVRAQNLQSVLNVEQTKFVKAFNDIDYSITKSNQTATSQQMLCVRIIEEVNVLISTYNSVLSEMIKIVTSAD